MGKNTIIISILLVLILIIGGIYISRGDGDGDGGDAMTGDRNSGADTMQDESPDSMTPDDNSMPGEDNDSMMEDDSSMNDESGEMMGQENTMEGDAMMAAGSYEVYSPEKLARAKDGSVVLFFRASWCPTCKTLDTDIKAHLKDIPADLSILDVDYDNSTALKQKYGVTYQHTLVQVDENGNLINKWSGSPTLASLVAQVK